eukprot:gene15281-17488_t
MDTSDGDSSLRFVPEMLVDYINKRNRNDLEPASFFVHGVCLLVDISGFTKLSGDYCEQGKSGIDSLQLATNGFMGRLVEIIYSFGGDIIKFAGDAIVCVFSADFVSNIGAKVLRRSICGFESFKINFDDIGNSSFEPDSGFNLVKTESVSADVILRVMHCARVLREVQTDKLTVHVALSCGEMCFGILGGFENRWECLISGPCIHELSGCLDDAPSKHAVMSAGCVDILVAANTENAIPFAKTTKDSTKPVVSDLETTAGKYTFEILPLESGNFRIIDVECSSSIDATTPKASGKAKTSAQSHLKLIHQFVPVPIAEELESAKELNLMAEIREVTTMFMKAEDSVGDHQISFECHLHLSALIQRLTGAATTPRRNSSVLIPSTRSARSWFQWMNTRSSAIATGTTMPIYVLHGKHGSGRTTVCTWFKAQAAELTLPVCSVRLGKKDTQDDFIVWRKIFLQLMPKDLFSSNTVQRNYVHNLLRRVYGNSSRSARTQGYPVLRAVLGITCEFADDTVHPSNGSGDSQSVSSINSIKQFLSIKNKPSGSHKPQAIQLTDTLVRIFAHLLSLRATVLIIENIELADEESLKLLMELTKISTRCAIVCTALAEVVANSDPQSPRRGPVLGKFNDSKEYKANAFNSTPWSKHYKDLVLTHKSTIIITLENYKPEEIDKMLSVVLGVRVVPPEISQIVQDFSGGSYFWVNEIVQFIQEHGPELFMNAIGENENNSEKKVTSRTGPAGGMLRSPSSRAVSRAQSFKQSSQRKLDVSSPHQQQLDKLVLARFGSMTTENQRVLRTASIIGMNFNSEVLQGVLPTHLKLRQEECLQTLLHQKWLYQHMELKHLYQFAHPHAHQIIYELTPSSERSNLHQLIADYIEVTYPDDRTQFAPLCFHYQHCDTDKALQYAVKAVAVMVETDDIYDFGDCLDLLTSLFEGCCHTIHDVEVLQALLNQAKFVIEEFDVSTSTEVEERGWRGSWLAALYSIRCCAPHSSYAVTPAKLSSPTALSRAKSGVSVISAASALNFNLGELRDEDEIRELNHETEGGDINYEARTKRLLLLQIKTFRNQLSQRYVDMSEEGGANMAMKDIIKFAGDAIICVFSADFISNIGAKILRRSICGFDSFKINFDDLSTKGFEPDAGFNLVKTGNVSADVILRVMQCAHQLRAVQTDKLTVHVAMSCGEMCFGILGGYENRWECLISGPCIHQLSGCLDDAPSKHAVMSAECVEVLVAANTENAVPFAETTDGPANNLVSEMETSAGKYTYDILPLDSGNYRIKEVQCTSTAAATTPKASGKTKSRTQPHLKLIHQFVPVPIAEELESAKELNLMAEIREVTTMFMK